MSDLTSVTGCTCTTAGWCERHRCRKNAHWFQLCQTRPDYFQLWETGQGPGQQSVAPASPASAPEPTGPGTELIKIIGRCSRFPHTVQLNTWGAAGCEEHFFQIVAWLCTPSAPTREPILSPPIAERFLRLAIQRAIAAEKKPLCAQANAERPVPPDQPGSAGPG